MPAMIIDTVLPESVASIARHTIVAASPEVTFAAIRRTDAFGDPIARALFQVRFAPERIAAKAQRKEAPERVPPSITFAEVMDYPEGFRPLGEDPPNEVIAGLIGKLWQKDFGLRSFADAEEFRLFAEPGYAKTVADFSVRRYGEARSLLSYEARTGVTDEESRQKFLRYWTVLRPGVAYVMRSALRLIRIEAERAAAGPPDAWPGDDAGEEVFDG